ncbi:MAG TPA: [FeFe] hydrogenase H-cluster radical SAM maturase HydE, partial [Sutterella sp.]|nr:[FeFe] hydrogenase H-cluster radical SAM maturase HydE [Sutterella sp.]
SPYPPERLLQIAMNTIAVVRILLPEVNIAAATALQALRDDARIDALGYGANVIMPNVTPRAYRLNYNLYDKKGGLDDDFSQTIRKLNDAIVRAHRVPALNMFGASVRYQRRLIEPS